MGSQPRIFARLRAALATPPSPAHLPAFAAEAACLVPLLLLLGFAGGLMRWEPQFDAQMLRVALIAIVAPALGEELLFRAAFLPRPRPGEPLPFAPVAVSTSLFVLWHPLQAPLFGPAWRALMLDPWFLAAVAALGVASSRLYWKSGSIWPSVALHWSVVVAWKALLDGPSP